MPRPAVSLVRLMPAPDPGPPDVQLLRAFTAARGEETFAEIVRRHGPMVLAACRRVLGNRDDADDAFQAVFLVLARKANAIRGSNLAGWLYAVAVRTARGVRIMRDRRRKHELLANPDRQGVGASPAIADDDLAAVIDEELARLPECYREVVVLCELRGLSRKQAAAEIGIPEGTLSSRLAAAKRKLAARLSARGLSAPAALAAALAPASVSAALVRSAVAATYGVGAPVASAAASAIVKAMLFDQLRAVTLAAGILLTVVCGGWAMTGTPGGDTPPTAPAATPAADPAAKLVAQLGAAEFADREAAQKALRELGPKAAVVLKAALKSEHPEVRNRAATLLTAIRADALDALAKGFDPAKETQPDHPVWTRFKTIAGDTRASRELFAAIIKNPNWLRRLDAAELGPEEAARQYREACVEVGEHYQSNMSVRFFIYLWPCDTPGQTAYLLLLGSYPGTPSARPAGQAPEFQAFADGEGRIHYARGLGLGLQGKEIAPGPKQHYDETAAMTPGTGGVFGRLLAAWLDRREPASDVAPPCLWLAARHGAKEVLPLARTIAADEFVHKRLPPPQLYAAALAVVAAFGTPADLPLFERHFKNAMVVATFEFAGANPVGSKTDGTGAAQVRDVAAGLALVLHGENPADHGFLMAGGKRAKPGERPDAARYEPTDFGFLNGDDKSRLAAHAKAKAFLDKQPKLEPKKEEPKPDPVVVKLVAQLGAPEFADREAAQKELRKLGLKAEAALKAALKSESPEIRDRAAKLLTTIRADALDALVKGFDPAKDTQPDHPVWKRYKAIAGDSRASRDLFAMIVANDKWLRTLDKAEANPGEAGHIYRVGVAEMFRDFYNDPAKSPPWPCDQPEEVAYLLFLGSYADSPTTKLEGDEIVPDDPKRLAYLGRGIIRGEEQIIHANGVSLGLEGKWLKWQTRPAVAGTDRVFAKLLAAWLERRDPASSVVPRGLRIAGRELVPFARRIAANDFEPKREIPPLATITALEMVARFGTPADLPHFERHFGDETNAAAADKARDDGARDYFRPPPLTDTTQMRDVALGLALLLHGGNPADFGFVVRKDAFKQNDGRYLVPGSIQLHLGFKDEAARSAAFKKAKAWLAEQKKPEPKKVDPPTKGAKVWPRFAKLIGDDVDSRALFDLIVANSKNLELLEKVTEKPDSAGKLYHDRWQELNKAARIPTGEVGSHRLEQAPLADALGWVYLGTFSGAESAFHQSFSLDFLPHMPPGKTARDELRDALKDKTLSAPLRRLIGKWTAARVDYTGRAFGLQIALAYDIKEVLPAARETLTAKVKDDPYPGNTARNVGLAMLVVGKLGTKDDLPLLEQYAKDEIQCAAFLHDPPLKPGQPVFHIIRPPIEGQDTTTQLRDVSVAMRLHLLGQKPDEFGFYWRWPHGPDAGKPTGFGAFYLNGIGFIRDADRTTAHLKAREWLDKQKK